MIRSCKSIASLLDARRTIVSAGSGHHEDRPLVLLVEDEDVVAVMAEFMLGQIGCRVIHCSSAEDTYMVFKEKHRDVQLVMLDMILPDGSGGDIFARLKTIDPHVSCLIASGYSLNDELQALIDDGVKGYIQKPYRFDLLKETVLSLL